MIARQIHLATWDKKAAMDEIDDTMREIAGKIRAVVGAAILAQTAYTITPVNNNYDNGGSVLLVVAPPSGQTVMLQRTTPLTPLS